jgi:hypothetical protein
MYALRKVFNMLPRNELARTVLTEYFHELDLHAIVALAIHACFLCEGI